MKSYLVICGASDEEPFMVEAENMEDARTEALKELGWYVVENEEEE
jgi:hypothetical protein